MYKILVRIPEVKRPLGRPRYRRDDTIGTDIKEIALEDVDWINLTWDRDLWQALVNMIMNLLVT
jgi:hypothetical protein